MAEAEAEAEAEALRSWPPFPCAPRAFAAASSMARGMHSGGRRKWGVLLVPSLPSPPPSSPSSSSSPSPPSPSPSFRGKKAAARRTCSRAMISLFSSLNPAHTGRLLASHVSQKCLGHTKAGVMPGAHHRGSSPPVF